MNKDETKAVARMRARCEAKLAEGYYVMATWTDEEFAELYRGAGDLWSAYVVMDRYAYTCLADEEAARSYQEGTPGE